VAQVNDSPRPPAGHYRCADGSDVERLIEWTHAFSGEAGVPTGNVERVVQRRVHDGELYVWEDDCVLSMVGTRSPVAGVVRLGPVYTPPEARRRGCGSALVAAVSRRVLASDATRCMLYTDLANPTSNAIYQAVGYKRSNEAQEYRFTFSCLRPDPQPAISP